MFTKKPEYGKEGLLVFADCAVMPNPTAPELASIAVATAATARDIVGVEPRVAMLSFSTKGSASHEMVDKVVEATRLAKEMAPELKIDGELQSDAALVESVASLKDRAYSFCVTQTLNQFISNITYFQCREYQYVSLSCHFAARSLQ